MAGSPAAIHPQRLGGAILADVVHALILRELLTRFGQHRLGALWMIAEPTLVVIAFSLVIGQTRHLTANIDPAVFIATGFVPWTMFRNAIGQVMHAAEANTGLFSYRQVRPIAPMVARLIVEAGLAGIVYATLLAAFRWWGLAVPLPAPLELVAAFALLALLALGLGMALCALFAISPSAGRSVNIAFRPLFWVSCVFYAVESLPTRWAEVVMWNPVAHAITKIRAAQFGDPNDPASWVYLAAWTLGALVFGTLCYRATWRRMVSA